MLQGRYFQISSVQTSTSLDLRERLVAVGNFEKCQFNHKIAEIRFLSFNDSPSSLWGNIQSMQLLTLQGVHGALAGG